MARQSYPSDSVDKLLVRFPEGMRDEIRLSANLNGRSMNAEIIHRLKNAFYVPEEGGPRVRLPEDLYNALMLDAFGRGVEPDERAAEILGNRYDPETEYSQLVDALAEEKLKAGSIRESNDKLKHELERDFVLYYGKVVQVSQFVSELLRDAGDSLPAHILEAAAQLDMLNQTEMQIFRQRYEDALFWVQRRDNERANDQTVAAEGDE